MMKMNLNSLSGFKAFISGYHKSLTENRSFPPLGLQKSLHDAAKVVGYRNWHEMAEKASDQAEALSFERAVVIASGDYLVTCLPEDWPSLSDEALFAFIDEMLIEDYADSGLEEWALDKIKESAHNLMFHLAQ